MWTFLKVGKLKASQLQALVLDKVGFRRDDVLVHAGLGEDCAVIDFGDEVCVLSTDPITGAFKGAGQLAVHVACNDIAASGASPVGVQVLLLVPESHTASMIASMMEEITSEAKTLGIEVLGGHTEVTSRVLDPVISLTAVGRAPKTSFVTSSGAQPGDHLVLTKTAGIEGSLVLIQDFAAELGFVTENDERELRSMLSVIPEGLAAAKFGVNAMHDVTEAGIAGAAWEMSRASKVAMRIAADAVPILPLTERICRQLHLNPLKLLSSGAMLIAAARGDDLVTHLRQLDISASVIGTVQDGEAGVTFDNTDGTIETITDSIEDELWRFLREH